MVSVLCMQIYLLHPWSDGMTLEEIFLTIIVFFFNCAYSVFFYLLAKSSPKVIAELKSTYLFRLFLTTAEFNFFSSWNMWNDSNTIIQTIYFVLYLYLADKPYLCDESRLQRYQLMVETFIDNTNRFIKLLTDVTDL